MRYFDTSFLVPLILFEDTSESIDAFFADSITDELAVSDWTRVEFTSMLAREVHIGGLDIDAAQAAGSRFEKLVQTSFDVLLPNRDDFDQARHWLGLFSTTLRAPDALHLAIAANRDAQSIFTLDKTLIAAARSLGLRAGAGSIPGFE